MKKLFLLGLTACLLGALAMTAGCGSAPGCADTQATEPQVLRVGMDASYPPFGSQNQETKDYEGFDVDIIRAIREDSRCLQGAWTRSLVQAVPALQARALMQGQSYVAPCDIEALAVPLFAHRLQLAPGSGNPETVVTENMARPLRELSSKILH